MTTTTTDQSASTQTQPRLFAAPGLGPYGLALALENARLRSRLPLGTRMELVWCHTPLQIAALSTEHLMLLLREAGVKVTPTRLRKLATRRSAAWSIAEEVWLPRVTKSVLRSPRLESMLGLSAVELWRRLLPGKPCAETLADGIEAGYQALQNGERQAAVASWLETWTQLQARAGAALDLGSTSLVDSPRDLDEWHGRLGEGLCMAAATEGTVDTALAFFRRSVELFDPTGYDAALSRVQLANLLFVSGAREEAEREFHALIEAHPDHAGMRLWYAEALFFGSSPPSRADLLHANALLEATSEMEPSIGAPANAQQLRPWVRDWVPPPDDSAAALVYRLPEAGMDLPAVLRHRILAAGAQAVPHLRTVLEDPVLAGPDAPGEGFAPVHAAELLSQLTGPEAIDPLLRTMQRASARKDEELEFGCIWAMRQLGRPALEPLLAAHHAASDPAFRHALRGALSLLRIHDDRAFALLVGGLGEEPALAAFQLARYGDERALGPLTKLVHDVSARSTELQLSRPTGLPLSVGSELETRMLAPVVSAIVELGGGELLGSGSSSAGETSSLPN
jgi:tetratricopeptide (TPR) repeat protein